MAHNELDAEGLLTAWDFVRWAASRFAEADLCFGHGTDSALDESLFLVLSALHLEPGAPDSLLQGRLTASERDRVIALVTRRIRDRVPAAYLVRSAWFAGVRLYVDERVLVPRSPLAEWIERRFEPWLEAGAVRRVLDLGTGSGCLALACAMAFPEARVDASDVSPGALEVAAANVARHGLDSQVRLVRSDMFSELEGPYDLIVSNPPYVDARTLAGLAPEYRHEPRLALASGDDGLDHLRTLLSEAPRFLSPDGLLAVEAGCAREPLEAAYPTLPFVWLDLERGGENVFVLVSGWDRRR